MSSNKELTKIPVALAGKLMQAYDYLNSFSNFLGLSDESRDGWSMSPSTLACRNFFDAIQKVGLRQSLSRDEMSLIWRVCAYLDHTNDGEVIKLAREISQNIKLSRLESITDLEQMRIYVDLIRYSQNDFRFTQHGLFEIVIKSVISGEIVDESGIILIKEACEYCIESPESVVKEMGFSMLGNLG